MSGRELEPVTAFFPSIDRNLMRELDRQLRGAQTDSGPSGMAVQTTPRPDSVTRLEPPTPQLSRPDIPRPDIEGVLDTVDQAALSIAMMTARIHELETHIYGLETNTEQLMTQIETLTARAETAESGLRTTGERMQRAELMAAHQLARGNTLESELTSALTDLTRVAEAIATRLGVSHED